MAESVHCRGSRQTIAVLLLMSGNQNEEEALQKQAAALVNGGIVHSFSSLESEESVLQCWGAIVRSLLPGQIFKLCQSFFNKTIALQNASLMVMDDTSRLVLFSSNAAAANELRATASACINLCDAREDGVSISFATEEARSSFLQYRGLYLHRVRGERMLWLLIASSSSSNGVEYDLHALARAMQECVQVMCLS